MDRIRYIPDRIFLTDEASDRSTTVEGFERRVVGKGKTKPESLILTLSLGSYEFLRIIAHRLDDGRWRVACLDVNLPAHLYGHNGRAIRTDDELALALTRVKHFVSKVVRPECWDKIIPGAGRGNRGFIQYVEAMVQIQDPGHRLILGSHVAHMANQHGRQLVAWGSYTRFKGTEVAITIYDKAGQRKKGILVPALIDSTRMECTVKNPRRLAQEGMATGEYVGKPGEVLCSLSLRTAYAVLRRNLGKLSGLGCRPDDTLRNLSSTARQLILGLGSRISKPHAVDQLLENYRQACSPCLSTFTSVSKQVRSHAYAWIAPDALSLLPADMDLLKRSDVRMPRTEKDFDILLRDTGAPMAPEPAILAAWSQTTFLKIKPIGFELAGHTVPGPCMPWKKTL